MKFNYEVVRRILRFLYNTTMICLLCHFFGLYCGKGGLGIWHFLLIIGVGIISYFMRELVYKPILVVIYHIILMAVIYFIPLDAFYNNMCIIAAFAYLIGATNYVRHSFKLRPVDDIPYGTFLLMLCMYAYGVYVKNEAFMKLVYIVLVICFILYILMIYIDGLTLYVKSVKDVKGLPLKRIILSNSILIGTILFIVLIVVFFVSFLNFDWLLVSFGKLLVAIAKLIASFFALLFAILTKLFSGGSYNEQLEDVAENYNNVVDNSLWANAFDLILKIGLAVLCCYAIYNIGKSIVKFCLLKRNMASDIVESIETEGSYKKGLFVSNLREEKKEKKVIGKARKIYKKKVESFRKEYIPKNYETAKEISEGIYKTDGSDISSLTSLYERVRYSNCDMTGDIVKEMEALSDK